MLTKLLNRVGVGVRVDSLTPLQLQFPNGFDIGWSWVHCNYESSRTSAILASYHDPKSITWSWALYWQQPQGYYPEFTITPKRNDYGPDYAALIPFVGYFHLAQQKKIPYSRG